jgi:hypothetical protein
LLELTNRGAVMIIQKTKDYSKFNLLKWNRPIDQKNVKKLIDENKKQFNFDSFPILVDENFSIIDGQHRFMACKQLGCDIYYIQKKTKASYEFVTSVNRAGKRHTIEDMINMAASSGDKSCLRIKEIYTKFNGDYSLSLIAKMITTSGVNGGSINESLRNLKTLNFIDEDLSVKILEKLTKFRFSEAKKMRFILSLKHILYVTKIDVEMFIDRIEKNFNLIRNHANYIDARINIIDAYNYKLKDSNKIQIGTNGKIVIYE